MELWDLYDSERRPLGRTHVRGEAFAEGEYYVCVEVWIRNSKGEFLIQKRHPDKKAGNLWEFVGGGTVAGETTLQSAVREVGEETGIVAKEEEFTLFATYQRKNYFQDLYLLCKDVDIKDIVLQPEEAIDVAWATEEEILQRIANGEFVYTCGVRFEMYREMVRSKGLFFENAYFIIGNAYAGKSTTVKELAKKHDGIACTENYHDNYPKELDAKEFPCLTYTRDLVDWHDFIRRSPQEYKAWIDGVKKECEILELRMLPEICAQGKPVFVDTNISIETLWQITPEDHVLVMLADPQISVRRFFERPDPEKQFLYRLILDEPDTEKAMQNYRQGLELINSQESYDTLLNSGFHVILRDEGRTIEQTLALAEEAFGIKEK